MCMPTLLPELEEGLENKRQLVTAETAGFLQMSHGGKEAETDYLARIREAESIASMWIDLKVSLDPEAELIDYNSSPDCETAKPTHSI